MQAGLVNNAEGAAAPMSTESYERSKKNQRSKDAYRKEHEDPEVRHGLA
jgi:hypothetical protein